MEEPAHLYNQPGFINPGLTLWTITIFHGIIHCKWQFSIAMLNYQRVAIHFYQLPSDNSNQAATSGTASRRGESDHGHEQRFRRELIPLNWRDPLVNYGHVHGDFTCLLTTVLRFFYCTILLLFLQVAQKLHDWNHPSEANQSILRNQSLILLRSLLAGKVCIWTVLNY